MQVQTVFKAGNSDVVVIPPEVKKSAGIKTGSKVIVQLASDGKTLLVSKKGSSQKVSSVTPQFLEILERVNKRYGPALKKLAKL